MRAHSNLREQARAHVTCCEFTEERRYQSAGKYIWESLLFWLSIVVLKPYSLRDGLHIYDKFLNFEK